MIDTTQISTALQQFCELKGSQNKAANALKGVSAATISQILSGKTDLVSEEMWRNIAFQIRITTPSTWQLVKTRDYCMLETLFEDAKTYSNVYGIVGEAGSGKSKAIEVFTKNNINVFSLQCSEFWNKKYFLQELLSSLGRDATGLTVADMMQEVIRTILKKESPLLILDEADKLTDQVLYFFITLYNKLEDQCGIVLIATDHLEKRINRGLKINKKGYKEIYSRIGRKFIELQGVCFTDVVQICQANGIEQKAAVKDIWEDSKGDLRRVKRKIHGYNKQRNEQENN